MKTKKKSLTPNEVEEIAQKANSWVSSAEGQSIMKNSLHNAEETTERLALERLVDPKTLRQPLNV